METGKPLDVTTLLRAWREGDATALERLTAVVYRELHQMKTSVRTVRRYRQFARAWRLRELARGGSTSHALTRSRFQ